MFENTEEMFHLALQHRIFINARNPKDPEITVLQNHFPGLAEEYMNKKNCVLAQISLLREMVFNTGVFSILITCQPSYIAD
jgi:hypothetical protein